MSESKCPCCGGILEFGDEESGFFTPVRCGNGCGFPNAPDLWPRIAAAMELAKFTVQMKTCRAYCPEMAFLHAQDRVLEVFK